MKVTQRDQWMRMTAETREDKELLTFLTPILKSKNVVTYERNASGIPGHNVDELGIGPIK